MPKLKIGLIQTLAVKNPADNLKRTLELVRKAAARGAKMICLQELFLSRYFCQNHDTKNFDLAEPVPGPTTKRLSDLARQKKIVLVASLFEKRAEGVYHNTAVVIDADGKLAGKYRKMHIPEDPYFYEKFYFTPGDLGFQAHQTRYGKIGVLVCWDQWFPEAARLTALQGAQILFYPTAIGWQEADRKLAKAQMTGWETVQRGHAVANGVFVAAVNRVGKEGPVTFWGNSFVSDPFGGLMAKAGGKNEEILIVECDLGQIKETRQGWPFLRDRRIDAYADLTKRHLPS
ncbi:MAG TPA: carbon-nitrogen hydrolase [bacterium]|nr:carbon-nitrogen hydrolase [bacterium]